MNLFKKLLKGMGFGKAEGQAHMEPKPPTPIGAQSQPERPARVPQLLHPDFGELNYDVGTDSYTAHVSWCGRQIEVSLWLGFLGETDTAINCALKLLSEQSAWMPRIEQYAASELLVKKNAGWLDEGEVPLSASDFVGKMSLESIDMDGAGNFTFWFDDGELFWGHWIQVGGSLAEGPNDACLG